MVNLTAAVGVMKSRRLMGSSSPRIIQQQHDQRPKVAEQVLEAIGSLRRIVEAVKEPGATFDLNYISDPLIVGTGPSTVSIEANTVDGKSPVIAGITLEGSKVAAQEAKPEAGLVYPSHGWLRFGHQKGAPQDRYRVIHQESGLPLILFQYPDATKATYNLETQLDIAALPGVFAMKNGVRNMRREIPVAVVDVPICKFSPVMMSICCTRCSTWTAPWWVTTVSHPSRSSSSSLRRDAARSRSA
jgi:Dihydrodipicolinate synthetase family